MLGELDKKMEEENVEAFVVWSPELAYDEDFFYLTRANVPMGGHYVKAQGEEPVLLVTDIEKPIVERETIVKRVRSSADYGMAGKVKRHGKEKARIMMFEELLSEAGVEKSDEVFWYGEHCRLSLVDGLREKGYRIKAKEGDLIGGLKAVKDAKEIEWIRSNGAAAEKVLRDTIELLRNCEKRSGELMKGPEPLRVGDVKKFMYARCIDEELDNLQGDIIVAPAEEGAEPHNLGTWDRVLREGEPIVLDFFPKGARNKYWFDTTRTVVVGKADEEVRRAFEAVREAQEIAMDHMKTGNEAQLPHNKVVEFFESKGVRDKYVHSLGHGLGVKVHEEPHINNGITKLLREGNVLTVEPGLYFPGKFGIRLEDVLLITSKGVENLSKLEKTLEI